MANAISRYRGDNYPDIFNLTLKDKSITDISGYVFTMAVTAKKNPVNNADIAHTILGVVVNPTAFQVTFTPIGPQTMLTSGTYYYEIEMTDDAGITRTIDKGTYKYLDSAINSETV